MRKPKLERYTGAEDGYEALWKDPHSEPTWQDEAYEAGCYDDEKIEADYWKEA